MPPKHCPICKSSQLRATPQGCKCEKCGYELRTQVEDGLRFVHYTMGGKPS